MTDTFSTSHHTESWDAVVNTVFSDFLEGYVHESRFLHDDESAAHKIVRASKNFESVFGCSVESYNAAGLWGGQYLPEDEYLATQRARALRRGVAVHADVRVRASDGRWRWLYTRNRPITDPLTHRVVGVLGVGQDITDRKRDDPTPRTPELDLPCASGNHKIAYTLHHGVAQDLTGVAMLLSAAAARPDASAISEAVNLLNHTIGDVQAMAAELSPLIASHDGLETALTLLVEDLRRAHHHVQIVVQLPIKAKELVVPFHIENNLYHIAREALYNAIKHSGSTNITLTVQNRPEGICLIVRDYGSGVSQEKIVGSTRGMRLMWQRAAALGAKLSITAEDLQGTTVVCRVPREAIGKFL